MSQKNKEKIEKTKSLAVIRVRGEVKLRSEIKDTLKMLRLHKKNHCVILRAAQDILGMVYKVKDYVTWGEINDEILQLLKEKRSKKNKKFFALSPPKGGFGRKGIKIPFRLGGALGDRKEKINDLIKRMI